MDSNSIDSMLDIYLFEANSLLEQLDEILINCEKQGEFEPDSINEIFRIMHTIKGSSAMMQFNSLMTVSHRVEDLFYYVRENGVGESFHNELFDLMFKCGDFLKSEIANIENNTPLTIDIGNLEEEIKTLLKKISGEAPVVSKEIPKSDNIETKASTPVNVEVAVSSTEIEPAKYIEDNKTIDTHGIKFGIRVFFDQECQMENLRAFMLTKLINDAGIDVTFFPSDIESNSETIDAIVRDGFFMSFNSQADTNKASRVIEQFIYVKDYAIIGNHEHEQPKAEEHELNSDAQVNNQKVSTSSPVLQTQTPAKQSLINVNLTKLDKLMDLVGEIVISESMITAIPAANDGSVDLDNFSKATRQLSKLTDELQEIVMSIRMVPVAGVFQKMNRIVRDMSKQLGKDVELRLIGEETEVDKTIVDSIGDPLMHLVRNAMDHGIEDAAGRIAVGKPEKGTITLSAQNTGGEILIIVQDDGKGMDPAKILKKAKEAGLLTKNDAEYTQKEILQFLLMPGFSTKDVATEFSGRGVGMDVVKKNVEKVGGDVSLESEVGKGSMVIFKIPLTLSIVKGMEVSVSDSVFTVPINNIRQSFKADDSNIMYDSNMREIVMMRNEYYPVIRLHELYGIETEIVDIKNGILILVEADEKSYCIFADALLGEHQVVVKPIPLYLNKYNVKESGIGGCAILGNGSITLILDIMNLGNNL